MSKTPLYDLLVDYTKKTSVRLHMPGHGGQLHEAMKVLSTITPFDVTELPATDNLYAPGGPIAEAEELARELFGSRVSVFCAGGATLALQTALLLAGGEGAALLVDRRCHQSVFHAMALLDQHPHWLYPEGDDPCAQVLSAQALESLAAAHPEASAVVVTSPTYYGVRSDIAALADVAHRHGMALVVDNAHGSHLIALGGGELHPIRQGADYVIDSAHKTLPALTGAAYLHANAPCTPQSCKAAMALFGSTSPSFPILASLDLARAFLADRPQAFERLRGLILDLRELLECAAGLCFDCGGYESEGARLLDPLRMVLRLPGRAKELFSELSRRGIRFEMADRDHLVGIPSALLEEDALLTAGRAVMEVAAKLPATADSVSSSMLQFETIYSPRKAVFCAKKVVQLSQSEGLIAAQMLTPYPPGVPVICPGERITGDLIRAYGDTVGTIEVISQP
ncbi:DegT/DnrJ/EryC1/StrS family aminotransferase [Feifania hominis]|uniref:PLP-dependent transferase n=1 Tax=Feifania hominis TaxID=2763660 RepID=A0A926DC68_9FIRM|nr:DegT/DnrJ/EryC1/StrS family aminotransferase [Feifania hominis]MBC8536275.1 PLP-dependent transferase [Feifania hominis]